MKKVLFFILVASLIVGCKKKEEKIDKYPIRVETEAARFGAGGNGMSYVGVVEESEATAVSFTTMGVIKRMLVNEGQMVTKGQLLAEIDATTPTSTVEIAQVSNVQAEDMVKQAENKYAQAKDAYDRMKILHDNGSIPEIKWVEMETNLRQAETALSTARANVTSAQATKKIAQKGVADTKLIAPVSGVIGKRQLNVGETALPSQAVMSILNIGTVKVKVSIPETELKYIGTNTPSAIMVEAANSTFNGGTIEKGIQADVATHTYDIRINVANSDRRLLPGMVATVSFSGGVNTASESQTSVPVTSVQKNADGSLFVWTVDKDKHAHRCNVTIGSTHGNRVSITGGLSDGQRIITQGYQKLSEGTRVIY